MEEAGRVGWQVKESTPVSDASTECTQCPGTDPTAVW